MKNPKKKRGRGRPKKYGDSLHKYWQEQQREQYAKHREVILYAMRHKISRDEARKILKPPKKFTGRRKK